MTLPWAVQNDAPAVAVSPRNPEDTLDAEGMLCLGQRLPASC